MVIAAVTWQIISTLQVSLAAQTLSSSVAVALETLHDLGLPKFQGCLATVDFIKVSITYDTKD